MCNSDCFVDECAGEYNFGGMLHFADATCGCFLRNSNLWASSGDRYQYGVYSNGSPVKLAGSKVRRSMHQDCLLKGRNFGFETAFYPFPPILHPFSPSGRQESREPGQKSRGKREKGGNGGN